MLRLLILIGIALLPIYTFHSGSVQVSDMFLALFVLFWITIERIKFDKFDIIMILLSIVLFVREAVALFIDPTSIAMMAGKSVPNPNGPALAGVFMAFNAAVVIALRRVPLNDSRYLRTVKHAAIASLLIALAGVLYFGARLTIGPEGLDRAVGTFNNPNQLSYFALCLASVGGIFYLRGVASPLLYFGFLAVAAFLVAASESRIGFVACGVLILFGLSALLGRRRLGLLALLACVLTAGAMWFLYMGGTLEHLKIMERVQNTGAARYDSLGNRGYRFPINTPIELLFGLGLKETMIRNVGFVEVHSTFWSFMISYGLIGFLLFMSVWLIWAKSIYRELGVLGIALVVMPASICGITQNGSRFTPFWLLIALSLNQSLTARRTRRPDATMLPPNALARGRDVAPQFAMVGTMNVRDRGVYRG